MVVVDRDVAAHRGAAPAAARRVGVRDGGDRHARQQREVADVLAAHHAGADDPVAEHAVGHASVIA
jgi:hypothetical protein